MTQPELDKAFVPVYRFLAEFEAAHQTGTPVAIAVERRDGLVARRDITVDASPAALTYAGLVADALLWQAGGSRLIVGGDDAVARHLQALYSPTGEWRFDYDFLGRQASGRPLDVIACPLDEVPASTATASRIARTAHGRSIGIDLGGSDMKYAATIDGEVVTSGEVVWHPKQQADPAYHFERVQAAIRLAAQALDNRVDYVCYSSAGMFDGHRVAVTSLF
ncbi:MAG: hypothetical protein LBI33_02585, partial [Propionibacteriaceae bacterium]|nr:hypothetical protein [Propionibacteriaceae bacterium]